MLRTPRRVLQAIACTAMWASTTMLGTTTAQDSVQTGDGLLSIRAAMPEQARVGEQFSYHVEVKNTSDNVVLHDIKLNQKPAKGRTIESVSMQGQSGQKQSAQNQEQGSQSKDSGQQKSSDKESSPRQSE